MYSDEQQEFIKSFLLDEDLDTDISLEELVDFISYLFIYWAFVLVYEVST